MTDLIEQTVILGGGFTGLYTALHLSRSNYPQSIVLIDRQDRFSFRPLFYEYFSEQMDADQVRPQFTELLSGSRVKFVQDTVESVNFQDCKVQLRSGTSCPYRNLVIGLGSVAGFFGVKGAKEHALPFREAQDAINLDERLGDCLKKAIQTQDTEQRRQLLTFVIVGGGPTGVELAATLADLVPNWYKELGGNPQEVRIVLLSRGSQILQGDINDPLRDEAKKQLSQRTVAVEILSEASATAVYEDRVKYEKDEETHTILTQTTIWTAGTATHPVIKDLPISEESRDKKGRLIVKPTLQLLDYPEVFAGGDCAVIQDTSYPPTAQVAHEEGGAIAQNLIALAEGKDLQPAQINILGSFVKLGLEDAAANMFNRFEVDGTTGHLIRQGAYMNVLPTPGRDLKMTAKWMNDEIFEKYLKPNSTGDAVKWVAGAIIGAVVARKLLKSLGNEEES